MGVGSGEQEDRGPPGFLYGTDKVEIGLILLFSAFFPLAPWKFSADALAPINKNYRVK